MISRRMGEIQRRMRTGIPWWIGFLVLASLLVLPDVVSEPLSNLWMRFPGLDKVIHFLAYAAVFLVLYGVLRGRTWPSTERGKLGLASVLCVLVAVADEVQQTFVAGRSSEYGDLVADTSGVILALTWTMANRLGGVRAAMISILLLVPLGVVTVRTYQDMKHYYRGMAYQRAHNYAAARAEYGLAVDKGMRTSGLYNEIAWIEIEFLDSNPVEAGRYAEKAVAMDPDNPDYLDTYGWILVKQGRVREGLALLEQAQALKPSIYCIDYHLGVAYHEIGDRERAIVHFKSQIELNSADRFGLAARTMLEQVEGEAG